MQKKRVLLFYTTPVLVLLTTTIMMLIAYAYDDWKLSLLARNSLVHLNNEVRIATKDLAEQMSMTRFAYWQAWLTLGALVVSSLGLVGLLVSLKQTQSALQTTREFAEIETSAFLHAKGAKWGHKNAIIINVWNSGQTPVGTVFIYLNVALYKDGQLESKLNFNLNSSKKSAMITPNDGKDIRVELPNTINKDQLLEPVYVDDDFNAILTNKLEINKDNILFCGEIHYKNIHDKVYKTQFAFYVGYENSTKFKQPACDLIFHQLIGTEFLIPDQP